MGEEKSVLRVGGLAGVLAGVVLIVGLIIFLLSPAPVDLEEFLAFFPDNSLSQTVSGDLLIGALLLILVFLAALYRSLREPSRVFARIGLGSGVLAIVVGVVALLGFQSAAAAFAPLYEAAASSDRPLVVAAYGVAVVLLRAVFTAAGLFLGLAFVAFGLAMRGSPAFGEGLAWLSVVLGGIIIVSHNPNLLPVALIAIVVVALVFGWKVYSLSRAA